MSQEIREVGVLFSVSLEKRSAARVFFIGRLLRWGRHGQDQQWALLKVERRLVITVAQSTEQMLTQDCEQNLHLKY